MSMCRDAAMSQPLVRELAAGVPLDRRRWIGEETRRGLPPYVYRYYLHRTQAYRRRLSFKVILNTITLVTLLPYYKLEADRISKGEQ